MYKRIIFLITALAVMFASSAVFAEELTVSLPSQSYMLDVQFDTADETFTSSGSFTADGASTLVIVSDGAEVELINASGEPVAKKSADKSSETISVNPGEKYTLRTVSPGDDSHASVFVYGF